MHMYAAMFCQVRVNAVTGEVRVSRLLGSFDCGRVVNAKTASSQMRGGMVVGLGTALMEETQFDERNGRIANPSLSDCHVPGHLDVPAIDVIWTDIPDPRTPMGAKDVGEIGITGTAAAIANAVFNATGRRVRTLRIAPEKLLWSCEYRACRSVQACRAGHAAARSAGACASRRPCGSSCDGVTAACRVSNPSMKGAS